MRGEHHDRYGHADAWYGPPAPPGADDVDAWATSERYRWAAAAAHRGARADARSASTAGAAVLERFAERHAGARASAHRAP